MIIKKYDLNFYIGFWFLESIFPNEKPRSFYYDIIYSKNQFCCVETKLPENLFLNFLHHQSEDSILKRSFSSKSFFRIVDENSIPETFSGSLAGISSLFSLWLPQLLFADVNTENTNVIQNGELIENNHSDVSIFLDSKYLIKKFELKNSNEHTTAIPLKELSD